MMLSLRKSPSPAVRIYFSMNRQYCFLFFFFLFFHVFSMMRDDTKRKKKGKEAQRDIRMIHIVKLDGKFLHFL